MQQQEVVFQSEGPIEGGAAAAFTFLPRKCVIDEASSATATLSLCHSSGEQH